MNMNKGMHAKFLFGMVGPFLKDKLAVFIGIGVCFLAACGASYYYLDGWQVFFAILGLVVVAAVGTLAYAAKVIKNKVEDLQKAMMGGDMSAMMSMMGGMAGGLGAMGGMGKKGVVIENDDDFSNGVMVVPASVAIKGPGTAVKDEGIGLANPAVVAGGLATVSVAAVANDLAVTDVPAVNEAVVDAEMAAAVQGLMEGDMSEMNLEGMESLFGGDFAEMQKQAENMMANMSPEEQAEMMNQAMAMMQQMFSGDGGQNPLAAMMGGDDAQMAEMMKTIGGGAEGSLAEMMSGLKDGSKDVVENVKK